MLNITDSQIHTSTRRPAWRSVGVWLVIILIAYILFNALRAVLDPVGFAAYYGLPLLAGNESFVFVYAIRAVFLGLFGVALLARQDFRTLALYVLAAMVMPLGDAALVTFEGGSAGTVVRHILTAAFLLVTWFFVRRTAQTRLNVE
jgi:hypothetical protein